MTIKNLKVVRDSYAGACPPMHEQTVVFTTSYGGFMQCTALVWIDLAMGRIQELRRINKALKRIV